ncbi:MAG: ABC transporter permease [Chloroflexota bacterium]|nr:ABC transporter permease [Chloroflexota bacterium]
MTAMEQPVRGTRPGNGWRRVLRDRPLVPLLILLLVLITILQVAQPGIVSVDWVSSTIRFAIPLAILAAAQTLTMLTAGIDLSVAAIASMSAYIIATQSPEQGPLVAVLIALAACAVAGLVNGIGVGVFRVHPLIMTLGMSLVVLGLVTVYQRIMVSAGSRVPEAIAWLGGGTSLGGVPNSLLIFVPLATLILVGLRRSGFGRLLYAVGDNEVASRLAGVRIWQVLTVLYVLSGLMAGLAGLVLAGLTNAASATLADRYLLPSVAAAVIGGTSIFGGRGGYAGTIVGALILTVLTTLLTVLSMPEPVRQILFGLIILAVAAAYTRITEES